MTSILALISAVGDIRLDDFCDICARLEEVRAGNLLDKPDDWHYRRVRDQLHELGHIELDYVQRKIMAISPRLALLPPEAGNGNRLRAVLTGARSVILAANLKGMNGKSGLSVRTDAAGDLLPDRIIVEGSLEALDGLARQLDVGFKPSPEAWMELCRCQNIKTFRDSATSGMTQPGEPPGQALCYEPSSGRFLEWQAIKTHYNSGWGLVQRREYDYYLFYKADGNGQPVQYPDRLKCDPNWGRWLMNQRDMAALFTYDVDKQMLRVPIRCPLPAELARVACLCSGFSSKRDGDARVYSSVPPIIAATMKGKLLLED